MKRKQKVADAFVRFTHEWNLALHNSIEKNVFAAYAKTFPNEMNDPEKAGAQIESMRKFYYQRMINTSSLLLAAASLLIATVALIIAMIALCIS